MKPKVCGNPLILLDPFKIIKTTLLIIVLATDNSFCDDFISEIHYGIDKFNQNNIITIRYSADKPQTGAEAETRYNLEQDQAKDIALNKSEIKDNRYWINNQWVCKTNNYKPAKSSQELIDSDNDGYDDYTEFKHGTSPNNPNLFPAIRDGNNKKIFK